jgi:Cu/Ag efflux protein CusF
MRSDQGPISPKVGWAYAENIHFACKGLLMLNPVHIARGLTVTLTLAVAAIQPLSVRAGEAQPASETPAVGVGVGVVIKTTARVVHIDPESNTVTLRGPRGNLAEVEVDPAIGDVKRLAIGDRVHIAYHEALLLTVEKTQANAIRSRIETRAVSPASGGRAAVANHVVVVASIQKVDLKKREVTLRGPQRTITVRASSDVPLAELHVGDSVRAEYVVATAVQVTRDGTAAQ